MKIQRRKRSRTLFALLAATSVAFMGACSGGTDDPLVMPDVVGLNLDVALSDLERVGYDEDPEILGGGTFGVVNESNWEVCEQLPAPGEEITTQPRLTVERDCGFGERVSDSLCAGAWFTGSPRIGLGMPQLVG